MCVRVILDRTDENIHYPVRNPNSVAIVFIHERRFESNRPAIVRLPILAFPFELGSPIFSGHESSDSGRYMSYSVHNWRKKLDIESIDVSLDVSCGIVESGQLHNGPARSCKSVQDEGVIVSPGASV